MKQILRRRFLQISILESPLCQKKKKKRLRKHSLSRIGRQKGNHLEKGRVSSLSSPHSLWGVCFIVGEMYSLNSNKIAPFISRACSSWWICRVAESSSNIIARTIVKKMQTFRSLCVYKLMRRGKKKKPKGCIFTHMKDFS